MNTQRQAELCADSAPKTSFGIVTILTIVQIMYYSFESWKFCHPSPATAKAEIVGDPPHIMVRRAGRSVRKAARHLNISTADFDVDTVTTHMLHHVYHSDDSVIVACFSDATTPEVAAFCESP